jgi:CheY-like chemotaxis protein
MNTAALPILIVDDDADLRQGMVDLLADEGYQAAEAGSGREALERLSGPQLPRLIVLDLMLPDLNGLEFLEIRSRAPRLATVPVLVVTASRRMAEDVRGAEVLRKPFSTVDLIERVRRLVT